MGFKFESDLSIHHAVEVYQIRPKTAQAPFLR